MILCFVNDAGVYRLRERQRRADRTTRGIDFIECVQPLRSVRVDVAASLHQSTAVENRRVIRPNERNSGNVDDLSAADAECR